MKLILSLVAILGLQACIISTDDDPFCGDGIRDPGEACDDGNGVAGDGCTACSIDGSADALLTANWTLTNIADGTATTCPPTFDTAAVYSQPVDANNAPVGQPIIDLFDCDDNTGVTAPLDPGVYQVWVEITSAGGSSVYAKSISAIVDLTTQDQTFSASILNDGGYFALSWHLTGGGADVTCAQATEVAGVGVIATEVANQNNFTDDQFDCDAYYGITGGLLAGTYTVSVSAFDSGNAAVGTAPALTNEVIGAQNQLTDLGDIEIPLD